MNLSAFSGRHIASGILLFGWLAALTGQGSPLEDYVQCPETNYAWKAVGKQTANGISFSRLELTAQSWHGIAWKHTVNLAHPANLRNPTCVVLHISGSSKPAGQGGFAQALAELFDSPASTNDPSKNLSGGFRLAQSVAAAGGMMAAEVQTVPFQPIFDGLTEDRLIAYTFDKYLKTGDETWPLLLPMVKSVVKAMDAIQAYAEQEYHQKIDKFFVTGTSKRGWTTWLVGAVDKRVVAVAPMNIDMLNMSVQTAWAQKTYGAQSEKIRAYTDLHLVDQMNSPAMIKLRESVDPYSYRKHYVIPKLILLGTNDPYWTVDSLRHYFYDLVGPKLVYQAPNTGHSTTAESAKTMAAIFQMVADKQELPTLDWELSAAGPGKLKVKVNQPAKAARLWTADSPIRDFRQAKWTSQELPVAGNGREVFAEVPLPAAGYRAFMGEVTLTSPKGQDYKLSTQVQVMPDNLK